MNLPPYLAFPEISTGEIFLRQVLIDDMKYIFSIQFYDGVQARDEMEAIAMQKKIDKDYDDGNAVHWGIADRKTNKIMGTLGYYRGFDKGIGELGCVLMTEFRGNGIMTKAMQLAINFGLGYMNLNRIIAITSKQNIKAMQLLERLGFATTTIDDDVVEYEWRT